MPYIIPSRKEQILSGDLPQNAGELTFEIQQCIARYLEGHGLRYQRLAEVVGALEGAKMDLQRRVLDPYEQQKQIENGDVWPGSLTGAPEHDDFDRPSSNAGPVIRQPHDPFEALGVSAQPGQLGPLLTEEDAVALHEQLTRRPD